MFDPKSQCEHRTALALCAIYRYIIGSLLSDKINYLPLWARMVRLSLCENIIARINIPDEVYIDGTHAYRNAEHKIRERESTMECDRCNKFSVCARSNIGSGSGSDQNVKCNKWHTWHAGLADGGCNKDKWGVRFTNTFSVRFLRREFAARKCIWWVADRNRIAAS